MSHLSPLFAYYFYLPLPVYSTTLCSVRHRGPWTWPLWLPWLAGVTELGAVMDCQSGRVPCWQGLPGLPCAHALFIGTADAVCAVFSNGAHSGRTQLPAFSVPRLFCKAILWTLKHVSICNRQGDQSGIDRSPRVKETEGFG